MHSLFLFSLSLNHCQILVLSDPGAAWSKQLGYGIDLTKSGMGERTGRWYLLLDDLEVVSTETEPDGAFPSFTAPYLD